MKIPMLAIVCLCGLTVGCQDPIEEPPRATASSVDAATAAPADATDTAAADDSDSPETSASKKEFIMATSYNPLSAEERAVLLGKGTQRAGTGEYDDTMDPGIYLCRQCNARLYRSDHKFDGHCGWPAFDDEIEGAVTRIPDADGYRTEIVCSNCEGHLGHVFEGERKTAKNIRHCVNSISMTFIPDGQEIPPVIILKQEK